VNTLVHRSLSVVTFGGYGLLLPHILCDAAVLPELSVRALSRIITVFGGRDSPPSLVTVQHLYEEIMKKKDGLTCATSGCLVRAPALRLFVWDSQQLLGKFADHHCQETQDPVATRWRRHEICECGRREVVVGLVFDSECGGSPAQDCR
jgi:hypothetical protein